MGQQLEHATATALETARNIHGKGVSFEPKVWNW